MFTRFRDDNDFDDLPEPEDEWGQREMALWAFRAVRILKKQVESLKAQNARGVTDGVAGASPRTSPADALTAHFGAVVAGEIRQRLDLTGTFYRSSLDAILRVEQQFGHLLTDEELQPYLQRLTFSRFYDNRELETLWVCEREKMTAIRYMLDKRKCIAFDRQKGWSKIKANTGAI